MALGEKVKSLRNEANLSLEDIATKTNIKEKKLKKLERNLYIPDREEIQKIAYVFNLEEKELMDEETIKDTSRIEVSISPYNFIFWVMNLIVFLFFLIVAFIPSLAVNVNENSLLYSFDSLLMHFGNPLIRITYPFSVVGFIISSLLIIQRYFKKINLSERAIQILNLALLLILILVVVTIFTVIIVYQVNFVDIVI